MEKRQPPKAKVNKKTIGLVIITAVAVGVFVWGAVSFLGSRNLALGFGAQQSETKLQTVRDAIKAADTSAILDVSVLNGNTSGTPFGHSIRAHVLYDATKVPEGDREARTKFSDAVQRAIVMSGIKDSYTVFLVPTSDLSERFTEKDPMVPSDAIMLQFKVK